MENESSTQERGLPTNVDAERFVLGSILLDDTFYLTAASGLEVNDFSLEKHRRIFRRMGEIQERGEKIDRVSVANELMRYRELESVDGLSYLVSLDEGLPQVPNIDSYIRIVKEKADLRTLVFLSQNIQQRAMNGQQTAAEVVAGANESLLRMMVDSNKTTLVSAEEAITNYPGGINALLSGGTQSEGLTTGYTKFDELTTGFHRGDLIILAARPSMGKTAYALNIAHRMAVVNRKTTAIFSLEMSKESLLLRLFCSASRVDSQKVRSRYITQAERMRLGSAMTEVADSPLYIDDSAMVTLTDIHSKLRRLKLEKGLDFAVIDYLQLMSSHGGRNVNRNDELGVITRGLKIMAKDLDIPVMVLSQLSRACDQRSDHRPVLSDLRESGNIEQDCDLCCFLFREEVYQKDREDLRGLAELIIGKQRNGPIGTVNLVFLNNCVRFENRAEDAYYSGGQSQEQEAA